MDHMATMIFPDTHCRKRDVHLLVATARMNSASNVIRNSYEIDRLLNTGSFLMIAFSR